MIQKQRGLIMNIGETQNGWTLTMEMVLTSIDSFSRTPIVLNHKENFKDYTDMSNYFNQCKVIGMLAQDPNIEIINDCVYADLLIHPEHESLWKGKYDNWCIRFNDDKSGFILDSIEVYE